MRPWRDAAASGQILFVLSRGARWKASRQTLPEPCAHQVGVEAAHDQDPVHAELLTKNGIFNHENLDFDALIKDRKYQFVYIYATTPIKGATGSPGAPIAVV